MVIVRMSVTSSMFRSSAIWQNGSTLITHPDKASKRLFETRSSRNPGARLSGSQRCAQHMLLCTWPQVGGRRVLTAESAKQSVMPPETCDARQLLRLPVGVVDVAPTPAILDKKIRRRVHIERCHEIIVVAALGPAN